MMYNKISEKKTQPLEHPTVKDPQQGRKEYKLNHQMDEVQNPHLPPAGCLCVWVMLEHIITNTLGIFIQISLPVNCTDVESKHSSVLFSQYGLQSHHVIVSPAP